MILLDFVFNTVMSVAIVLVFIELYSYFKNKNKKTLSNDDFE